MKILFAFCAMALALAGCATGDAMRKLELGMTRAQAVAILGQPDGVSSGVFTESGPHVAERLTYADRRTHWAFPSKGDYQVTLVDGRVASFGPTAIRAPDLIGAGVLLSGTAALVEATKPAPPPLAASPMTFGHVVCSPSGPPAAPIGSLDCN